MAPSMASRPDREATSLDREPGKPPNGSATTPAAHNLLAIQRTAGNQAVCQLLRTGGTAPSVQRLWSRLLPTEYTGNTDEKSDLVLMKIWALHKKGELDLIPRDVSELTRTMQKRGLDTTGDSWKRNPLDLDREHMKTSGAASMEIVKPTAVVSAGLGGDLGGGHVSHSSSAGGGIGGEIVDAALLADSVMGLAGAYSAHGKAKARGDTAGVHIATGRAKTAGWGVAGGSVGTAEVGMKVGTALGSTAVGLAAATGALGVVGGAITVAQGAHKIAGSARKLSNLGDVQPVTPPGRGWKGYIAGREQRKIGVNALKVAAGALGIAAGALLIVSNPVGWAVGIAAMVTGGAVAGFKLFQKIKKSWKQRSSKKKMEAEGGMDELAQPAPGGHAAGSPEEQEARRKQVRALADKVSAENSQGSRHASEMVAAVREGDSGKGDQGVRYRDTFHPRDGDFSETIRATQAPNKVAFRFSQADLKAYDAQSLLDVLNVTREEALSESGQDLIARKMSVSAAS